MSNNVTLPAQGTSGSMNPIVEALDTTGTGGAQRQFVSLRSGTAGDTSDVLGPTNDTAPSTDTATSSVNGRLQRIAQNLTSILTKLSASIAVTGTFWQATQPVSIAAAVTVQGGNKPVGPASAVSSQATISTSASLIVAARTGVVGTGRVSVTLKNSTGNTVFIGPSGVTTSTGYPLMAGEIDSFDTTAAIYGISGSTGNVIGVLETF